MSFSRHTPLLIGIFGYAAHLFTTSLLGWSHAFIALSPSAIPELAFSVTNCLSFLAGLLLSNTFSHRRGIIRFVSISFAISLAGVALLGLPHPTPFVILFSCSLLGAGNGFFFLLWQEIFFWQNPEKAPRIIILGSAFAGIVSLAVFLPGFPLPFGPTLLAALTSSVICLLFLIRHRHFESSSSIGETLLQQASQTLSSLWRAAFCAGALGFARCMTPEIALQENTSDILNTLMYGGRIASAALLLLAWPLLSRHPKPLEKVYYAAFPVIATGFLFLPFGNESYQLFLSVLTYIAFAVVSMLMMILCLEESRRNGRAPSLVYGLFAFIVYSLADTGYVAAKLGVFTTEKMGAMWVAILALAAVYVLSSALFATRHRTSHVTEDNVKPDQTLEKSCSTLAAKGGLSPREQEVLNLILQGRDLPRISQALFISENTVRSHMKNIYRKLDVHSKQEVLDLLEQP